ncbi:MAG: hypothetical protein HY782_08175 [Chloroflexi bacterium]|nr:hypothetical protein [Chloroflexota bacterium]
MFRLTLIGVALLAALLVTVGCSPAGPVAVEIAYRNHPPVRDVLVDVDSLLAKYDKQVQVTRYDVDTPEGDAFLKTKQVTDPCVLAIFIKGSMAYQQVKFFSFPVGKGTAMTAAGNWTPADLDAALALATGSKK